MKVFEEFQSVGKALMLSVAFLPVAAILLRFRADDRFQKSSRDNEFAPI